MVGPKAGANWAVLGFVVIAITQWYVHLLLFFLPRLSFPLPSVSGPDRHARSSCCTRCTRLAGLLPLLVSKLINREVCNRARAKELAQMKLIQEKFPHRHVSTLQRDNSKPV
jgi:hypothetical protein